MTVILHLPVSQRGAAELHRRVAQAHASAATDFIRRLPCPKEQKRGLLTAVARELDP